MSYVIGEACVDQTDQSCVAVCPVDCISSDVGADRKFYIDPDGCIDCGSCATACPNDAIHQLSDLPRALEPYAKIDATWFRDQAAARELLQEALLAGARR